ncbi:unnamed protein product [Ilex paraguariensis]|uniref:Rho termination factor-like N-terminal domain-containing protein n=1 Tax=Ilex paraguariensis TaxID=185542 RepID=A0ABC8TPM4_9AQUA
MSQAIHLISRNVPGYVPSDGTCLPCSGVSGRAVNVSPCSSRGDYKTFSLVKNVTLKCDSKSNSSVCNASSSNHRRNQDFSRQNKHGFSRSWNRQNEERDGYENVEESEVFSSKNGPLFSGSGSPKFQATSSPGPREMEIVELFRKVQAELRERAAIKEEKKIEDSRSQSRESETVDSLLKLLRKHSVQRGKRSSNSSSNRDFILDQPEQNGPFSEEKSTSIFDSNNAAKHDAWHNEGALSRPKSNFQRRSPIPQMKFQPSYPDKGTVNSVSETNINGRRKETSPKPDYDHEPKLMVEPEPEPEPEPEHDPEPIFSDGDVFDEMSENEISDIEEEDSDDVETEEQNLVQLKDLSGMKLAELRALAKSRGLKGFSKLKKRELLELLTGG